MKEETYMIRQAFGNGEIEVTYEGSPCFEWDAEGEFYIFSCLVSDAASGELGKCYGEVSATDYDNGIDAGTILENPMEYCLNVEFD